MTAEVLNLTNGDYVCASCFMLEWNSLEGVGTVTLSSIHSVTCLFKVHVVFIPVMGGNYSWEWGDMDDEVAVYVYTGGVYLPFSFIVCSILFISRMMSAGFYRQSKKRTGPLCL